MCCNEANWLGFMGVLMDVNMSIAHAIYTLELGRVITVQRLKKRRQ
ncbi:hypothetical protein SAMN05192553_11637 [Cyclobacterium xiamenense]|uniref:Uncharacterized protein n=1 Tax=Cyclobacterium xiamenense TaxID=1297121 RepID=A0A1H7BWC8_9BACT|nr:hypothetical protein SAMN05192553_11637 [Cyclobacterium xiamenense]